MGKKTYTNYDDTLFGQYIRQLENPDSIGWDADAGVWRAPQGNGFDSRNRGMGVDVLNNDAAIALTQGRPGKYLTEKEENQLRNEHIQYLLNVIDNRKKTKTPALNSMSPKKQAQVLGIMYRGDGKKLWDENSLLGKALNSSNDADMDKAIEKYYNSKGLGERARNDAAFWNEQNKNNEQTKSLPKVSAPSFSSAEPTDAIRSYKPTVTPSPTRRNAYKAMQDKVNFNRFMDSISIQNNLPPAYTPHSNFHDDGGSLDYPDWGGLSMKDRADVMKLFIDKGIYDLNTIRKEYNSFAKGGKIHIKPENRGKFTALKKRTGHSSTWFKEHGTPAQKKMAVFALNARKWKH